MTATHTPRPWIVRRTQDNVLTVSDGDMAHQLGPRTIAVIPEGPDAEKEATLLAAAPALLAAVHDLLWYCVTPTGVRDKGRGRTDDQQRALDSARAIAAAQELQP